jgi:transcription termination/antitermination protein NusA
MTSIMRVWQLNFKENNHMINAKEFIKALDELESEKGISKESIISALKEAMEKAYRKQLGTSDDALVRVDIDSEKGNISMYQLKQVVEEVEDDFLQISLEEVKQLGLDLKVGDTHQIEASIDDLSKLAAINVKNILRQKIAEAEKAALYELFKDKIGEMITGVIEKIDERSAIINIGRTSVYLPSSHFIPGEIYKVGDRIKLYLVDVISTPRGAQIAVSRTDPGFLKRLFEEEIHEIYEGTVIIKNIAREAGERSKVSVYSTDINIDPAGACIGPNGSRIQKIVGQLGNNKDKEKIDIIAYSPISAIYIMEALKPAQVVGVSVNEETKEATAVVENGQLSLAIGKRGVNARLAVKLTGFNIDIKEHEQALNENISFMTAEEWRREEEYRIREAEQQAYLDSIKPTPKDELPVSSQPVIEQTKVANEEPIEAVIKPEEQPKSVKEEIKVPKVEKPKEVREVKTVVKTTKTLEDLEKELERDKEREAQRAEREREKEAIKAERARKKASKKDESSEHESKKTDLTPPPSLTPTAYMDIYTEEELKEMNEVEEEEIEEDFDYEEFEDYYDEKE